jgi:hypothetical protein
VAQRVKVLDEVILDLGSPQGILTLGRKCPTVAKTRWIHAVDVLHFVLQYADDVNKVRTVLEQEPVPDNLKTLYSMLSPLSLSPGTIQTRNHKLYEVMPIAHATSHEFREVRNVLSDDEDLEFLMQLQRNSSHH